MYIAGQNADLIVHASIRWIPAVDDEGKGPMLLKTPRNTRKLSVAKDTYWIESSKQRSAGG